MEWEEPIRRGWRTHRLVVLGLSWRRGGGCTVAECFGDCADFGGEVWGSACTVAAGMGTVVADICFKPKESTGTGTCTRVGTVLLLMLLQLVMLWLLVRVEIG